ncbi:hypothetical protein C6P40_000766 [Pichia californica]|uniref:Uncharacterized protein n=1 Tax=Pichia californica TaxID=460514 RepID=A0A9P6WK03_9ASCO|nr:hypothetical protein C6P40_000766 [[Candida] californica]
MPFEEEVSHLTPDVILDSLIAGTSFGDISEYTAPSQVVTVNVNHSVQIPHQNAPWYWSSYWFVHSYDISSSDPESKVPALTSPTPDSISEPSLADI